MIPPVSRADLDAALPPRTAAIMTSIVKKIELHRSVMHCFFFSARAIQGGEGSAKRSGISPKGLPPLTRKARAFLSKWIPVRVKKMRLK
jgi:hypothetical protein